MEGALTLCNMLPFDQTYQVGFLDVETKDILVRIYYPTKETVPVLSKYTDSAKQYAWGMSTYIKSKFLFPIIASIFYFHKGYLKPGATLCTEKKWPVMIFSHGLSGQRLIYSQYIGELVSLGMIVIALEHRDQSASASAMNGCQNWMYYEAPNFSQKPSHQSNEEFERNFRFKQMDIRKHEIQLAVTLAESLNRGEFIDNLMQKKQGANLQDKFKNCMDLKQLFIGGHSFGASTAINILQQTTHPFVGAILIEPWMLTVYSGPIQIPVLYIQSEKYYSAEDLKKFQDLVKESSNATVSMICKTKYQDILDGVFLFYSNLSRMGLVGTLSPKMTFYIARNLSCSYLASIHSQFEKISGFYPNEAMSHSEVKFNQDAIQHLKEHV